MFFKAQICDAIKHVYIWGPSPMMDAIEKQLSTPGIGKNGGEEAIKSNILNDEEIN